MVRLILGDQLNRQHTWFSEQFDNITYAFFECYDEATYAPHHIQKVLGIFAVCVPLQQHYRLKGTRCITAA